MKKLNKTEAELFADRVYDNQLKVTLEQAENKPEIKKVIADANKLLRFWQKADDKAKQEENNFKKFLSDNKILIEGDFGDIMLNFTSEWNYEMQEHVRKVFVDISQGVTIRQKLFKEILLAQIDSENLQELEVKVLEGIRKENYERLLT
jgi:phage antirepressor YoqD-like protein|tara:strand:+ start:809 stop:1255 length:447 start_codon:yes stop_codon:yes gene_type:complete